MITLDLNYLFGRDLLDNFAVNFRFSYSSLGLSFYWAVLLVTFFI